MAPIAPGDEVEAVARGGVEGGAEGGPARQGDGGRGQTGAGVGVVGGIPQQIGAAQITVEGAAEAKDDGGVGLQAHAQLQAADEDPGDGCPLTGQARLLFDDGGQDQGLLRIAQGQARGPVPPFLRQHLIHGLGGALEEVQVTGALGEAVGIGEEAPLRALTGPAQGGHEGLRGHPFEFAHQAVVPGQGGEELGGGPALDEGDGALVDLIPDQFVEEGHGRGARGDLILAGLDARGLTAEMGEGEKEPGMFQHPQARQFPCEGAQGHAGGNVEEEGLPRPRRGRHG